MGQPYPGARTRALIDFTDEITKRVQRWLPQVRTARNMFALPVFEPKAEAWTAQNLATFNEAYDFTAIMAMPQLDKQSDKIGWYRNLARKVAATPGAFESTVFEFASHDWRTNKPIPAAEMGQRMRTVQSEGAWHIGYYPDDFLHNRPDLETIRPFISASDYPWPEPAR